MPRGALSTSSMQFPSLYIYRRTEVLQVVFHQTKIPLRASDAAMLQQLRYQMDVVAGVLIHLHCVKLSEGMRADLILRQSKIRKCLAQDLLHPSLFDCKYVLLFYRKLLFPFHWLTLCDEIYQFIKERRVDWEVSWFLRFLLDDSNVDFVDRDVSFHAILGDFLFRGDLHKIFQLQFHNIADANPQVRFRLQDQCDLRITFVILESIFDCVVNLMKFVFSDRFFPGIHGVPLLPYT